MAMDNTFDMFVGNGWGEQGEEEINASHSAKPGIHDKIPIPVEIEALANFEPEQEKYKLGSYEFNTVRLMGKLVNVSESPCISHDLCDAMAPDQYAAPRISVVNYADFGEKKSALSQQRDKFEVGQLVQAVGKIRLFNNRLSIIQYNIREVTMPEVELFKMECQLAKLYYEKGIVDRPGGVPNTLFQTGPPARPDTGMAGTPQHGTPSTRAAAMAGGGGTPRSRMATPLVRQQPHLYNEPAQSNKSGLSVQQQKIVDFISANSSDREDGVHVDQIKAAVGPYARFQADLTTLLDDGLVYSTVDDFHYNVV